ncbi:MAG: DUF169 domain-containing protein [Candidatus Verstraetearchaeota archaeon]|nr:DUF169 domain-containing protein [Candidatus Verstraetearchaeota archaeon]
MDYAEIVRRLKEGIGIVKPPVAVKFLKPGESIPEGFSMPGKRIRFCQAVMEASWGKPLAVSPTEMACGPGPASFGAPVKDKVFKGEVHHALGLFEKPEAAVKCLSANTKMMPGSVAYALVSPLERGLIAPDVIIMRVSPEQAMWICQTWCYSDGEHLKIDLQTEASVCSGVAVSAFLKNEIQIGLGCYGSRTSTDIEPGEMLIGIPGSLLEKTVERLEKLSKPVADSRSKRIYREAYPGASSNSQSA